MAFVRLVFTALLWPPTLVGALICAILAAAAQLGRISPSWDVLTHFAPLYLGGSLVAALLALGFHGQAQKLVIGAGLSGAVLAGLLMAPEYLRNTGPRAAPGATPTLKIIQFNAWDGGGAFGSTATWLAAQKPDVVVVQEANRRVRDAIVARTGWHVIQGRSTGMIFTAATPVATFIPASEEAGPMETIGVTLKSAAGDATVFCVHYPWPTSLWLKPQAEALKTILRNFPPATTILAGDFNSTPWSFARQREDRGFGLIRRTRALFSWPTRPLPFPVLPIDHVYAGSAWATVGIERGPKLSSDHYPLIITLAPLARR